MLDDAEVDEALVTYLSATSLLTPSAARRCIAEVLAFYSDTLETFVVRRHGELRQQGELRNDAIYQRIIQEAQARRFALAPLTPRQVRRIIYG